MRRPLRLLHIEDSEHDAALIARKLEQGGYELSITRVATPGAMHAALRDQTWDLIIADWNLPQFSALFALEQLKCAELDLPFIIVSGAVGEEAAVAAMKAGAHDYVMKDNLKRLVPAVEREVREANARRNRQKTEAALEGAIRQSEELFRLLVASLKDYAILMLDTDGHVVNWNAGAEHIKGYQAGEIIGQHFSRFYSPEDIHGGKPERDLKAAASEGRCEDEVWHVRKDGTQFRANVIITAIRDEAGTLRGFSAVTRDITERLTLERELNQAQKLESVGRLASGIAHEINTPTQFVGDNVRFLSDSFSSIGRLLEQYQCLLAAAKTGQCPKALIDTCEAINREADMEYLLAEIPMALEQTVEGNSRVARIVGAMKHFAHPDSEEKTYVNLNHAIENTVIVTRNEWKFVADLTTDLASDLPLVPCLLGQFNQVILNMIINATHAIEGVVQGTPQKGLISITSRQVDTWAEIRITDTGTGMPEDIQHKIFDPFFTTKEVGKGTGQGLAIARSVVVDKHGGTIAVVSQVGKGTTFIIRLGLHDSGAKQLCPT